MLAHRAELKTKDRGLLKSSCNNLIKIFLLIYSIKSNRIQNVCQLTSNSDWNDKKNK